MNPYQILGLAPDATPDEVKQAYRKLAKENHPDLHGGSEEASDKFRAIQQAYDMLRVDKPREEKAQHQHFNFHEFFRHHQQAVQFNVMAFIDVTLESLYRGCNMRIRVPNENEEVDIDIPAGSFNGQQIVIPEKGGRMGSQRGMLILTIRQIPHTNFGRNGDDLLTKLEIDFVDMLVGTEREITHLDGSKITIVIPKNSNPQSIVMVAGKGMPNAETNIHGNLQVYLTVNWRALTDEQLEIIKSLTIE